MSDPVGPSRGPPPTGPGAYRGPGVNAGPGAPPGGKARRDEEVCGLALGAVEARMPLRGLRMDSEGLTGLGWHWSTPRTF
nr:MAG TPA: hypothetical protein [Caudoviricetes sp.]